MRARDDDRPLPEWIDHDRFAVDHDHVVDEGALEPLSSCGVQIFRKYRRQRLRRKSIALMRQRDQRIFLAARILVQNSLNKDLVSVECEDVLNQRLLSLYSVSYSGIEHQV